MLVSKGYGSGGLLLELEPRRDEGADVGGTFGTREVWRDPRLLRTKFTNVVLRQGFVYGLDDGMLECVELESGSKRWKEGRYGHGQVLLAGDLLLVCSEEGELSAVEPSPERPNRVLGRFQALEGKCWAHLCLAGDVLLVRNGEQCAAWRLPVDVEWGRSGEATFRWASGAGASATGSAGPRGRVGMRARLAG